MGWAKTQQQEYATWEARKEEARERIRELEIRRAREERLHLVGSPEFAASQLIAHLKRPGVLNAQGDFPFQNRESVSMGIEKD